MPPMSSCAGPKARPPCTSPRRPSQLLEHLAAIEGTTVPDQGILAVLARAAAQLLVSGIELDGACDAA